MMPVYAISGCGLERFLTEARESGWTILGTVGSERLSGRERGERREGGGPEEGGEKMKKPPVLDCHQYRAEGPTMVVLGKAIILTQN